MNNISVKAYESLQEKSEMLKHSLLIESMQITSNNSKLKMNEDLC